jgi:molecular chaperone HscA
MDRAIGSEVLEQLGWLAAEKSKPRQLTRSPKLTPAVVRLVLDQARQIKHALTAEPFVDAEVPLPDGGSRTVRITRARFEELIVPLLERTGTACKRALRDAGLKPEELDGVILVGGATRVPAVRAYVKKLFGKEPLADVDPDQVVALGAAVQADLLAGQGRSDEVLLLDVIPLSLGIEVGGGVVDKILPRNTTIPTAARATYTTQQDNQTGFEVHVVQGEREMVADCRSLARFTLKGIPPMPAGLARLEITFRVDADGILSVHAKETTTGIEQNVTVKPTYGLDDDTVEQMLIDALDHGEEDLTRRRVAEGRVEAQRILLATRKSLESDADLLEAGEQASIEAAMSALEAACRGADPAKPGRADADADPRKIQSGIDELDRVTKSFAGRRMNRAIARAIGGRKVDEVNAQVEHAKGIENAHETWPK